MVTLKPYMPADVVPREELIAWRRTLKKEMDKNCPEEVKQFIDAMAAKMPDFERIRNFNTYITGEELLLANMREYNGVTIDRFDLYPMPVPHMMAVDHHTWMHRIFKRRGKQGLIDYCHAKCNQTELARILDNLNVNVFYQERAEFKKVMKDINEAKKQDAL